MPYGTIYRLNYDWKEKEEIASQEITVHIIDTDTEGAVSTTYTDLIAATSSPVNISVIDNDKNKYKSIRAKQADIFFLSGATTARTFSDGPDNKWMVDIFVTDTLEPIFKGFLVMDGHEQPFLPVGTYTVHLTAIDNLGTLKEIPLTKDDNTNPRGIYKIIQYIAWCLKKTGLDLEIIINDTWMEEDNTTFHPQFDLTYLYAKTFEGSEINTSVNCYRALEIILGTRLTLFQYKGAWYISAVDERTSGTVYRFRFDKDGTYIGQMADLTFNQLIGKSQEIRLINKNGGITFVRPVKFVKTTFNYDYPREILDNIDFRRGALNGVDLGNPLFKAYTLDDWTIVRNSGSVTSSAYIVRKFRDTNLTYEAERYIRVLPASSMASPWDYLRSSVVPLHIKDKITVSVDFRFESAIGGGSAINQFIFNFHLFGSNGLWYYYQKSTNSWIGGTATLSGINWGVDTSWNSAGTDEREWQTFSVELPPLTHDGDLYVGLYNANTRPGASAIFMNYANLRFDYQPYINGDYSKYASQSNKVTQDGGYKANVEEEIYLGASPKKIFKGSQFKNPSPGVYVLTENYYAAGDLLNQGITPPIPAIYLHSYEYLQVFALFNQYNRRMIELQGSLKGLRLTAGTNLPDLIHSYEITTTTSAEETENKTFMLTSFDQDPRTGNWSGTLVEVYDSLIGKDYDDDFEFKYISDY